MCEKYRTLSDSASRPISDMGLLNALRRMGLCQGVMTIHGFRSVASTLLNEQGYSSRYCPGADRDASQVSARSCTAKGRSMLPAPTAAFQAVSLRGTTCVH